MEKMIETLYKEKLVLIARRIPLDKIGECARAAYKAGIRFMESTFDQTNPDCIAENQKCIQKIIEATDGKMYVGAGTVLSAKQVKAAYDAGAKYIISPNTKKEVIDETKKLNLISIPGAMTPTEIEYAYSLGADIVKLFPADDMGFAYIKNLQGPLSHIPLMATGGVNSETIPVYYQSGIKAFGTGITILKPEHIKNGDYEKIYLLAKAHTDVIKNLK